MVAYSFKSYFSSQIVSGSKRQTVRGNRPRHARPDEAVQLYEGMRTRQCRKLLTPDPICVGVDQIIIERQAVKITGIEINGIRLSADEIENFAQDDGFAPEYLRGAAGLDSHLARHNMAMFWSLHHPDIGPFIGTLIRWDGRSGKGE